MSQSKPAADPEITRYVQAVAAVRIGYGVIALFAPRFWPKVFRIDPDDADARAWNAFLGSRDIAIGVHSLLARSPQQQQDAILINQLCEVCDTMVVGQEIRHGRPFGMFTAAGIVFNGAMHAVWIKVRLLQRR